MEAGVPINQGLWFHPHLNWKEKLVSKLVDYMMLTKILGETEHSSKESEDILATARNRIKGVKTTRQVLQRWETLAKSPIAVAQGSIPFRSNILKEWGIVDHDTTATAERDNVPVLVRFPSSLLDDADTLQVDAELGCRIVDFETIDWSTFAPNVPVILQFHGGGMIMGQADDVGLVEETIRVVETADTAKMKCTDVITISVDYALAPEHPFPTAVIDALSVLDFWSVRKRLHLSGMSAGANLALVAGLEGFRKFSTKIQSIRGHSPFCDPAGDSWSYYENQCVYPSIAWLRWCWRAYLGMETVEETSTDLLRQGSNHTVWNQWKERNQSLARLVNPALGIPPGLDDKDTAPCILIQYNLGDPLYSEGKMLAQALQGTKTHPFESAGVHCDLTCPYDPTNPQEYWKVWAEALFGPSD